MKSLANLLNLPAGEPLLADDVLELHASRILLLISLCGTTTRSTGLVRLDGLTKMAKLDFLVRYPSFYEQLAKHMGKEASTTLHTIESSMVRFHYGPWDNRYYHVLAYLESRGLVVVGKDGSTFQFVLTEKGTEIAESFSSAPEFSELATHIRKVKKLVGSMVGSKIKNLIYDVFGDEVLNRKYGEVIK